MASTLTVPEIWSARSSWRGRSGVSSATAASAPGLEATTEPLAGKGIVIGADVGGTFVKAAVTGPERAMRRRIDKPTRAEDGREPVVEAVVRRPGALAQGLAGSARRGVGDSLFLSTLHLLGTGAIG